MVTIFSCGEPVLLYKCKLPFASEIARQFLFSKVRSYLRAARGYAGVSWAITEPDVFSVTLKLPSSDTETKVSVSAFAVMPVTLRVCTPSSAISSYCKRLSPIRNLTTLPVSKPMYKIL